VSGNSSFSPVVCCAFLEEADEGAEASFGSSRATDGVEGDGGLVWPNLRILQMSQTM